MSAEEATALLRDVATRMGSTLAASKPVLLGERDPRSQSCVLRQLCKDGLAMPRDPKGGPGTALVDAFLSPERGNSPRTDFVWLQKTLKPLLESRLIAGSEVTPEAEGLADRAARLAAGIAQWSEWPHGVHPPGAYPRADTWVGFCLKELGAAVTEGNLHLAKVWAEEFAAATFALADLHRWLDFLLRDQLAALAFQQNCEALFAMSDASYGRRYDPSADVGDFPGGLLLAAADNYLEVERQAEWLFRVPPEYLAFSLAGRSLPAGEGRWTSPAARWMPPDQRTAFEALRSNLSPGNQRGWDEAAASPFEHSYLVNMLFRARGARVLDRMGAVLQRFSRNRPEAPAGDLMDVIFYRGGDANGGIEWGDRYDPRLMAAAAALGGSDEEVLRGAARFTHEQFGGWENYGQLPTLRQSLDHRKLDCRMATDMIGSLYRNAGRSGFYCVQWCAGIRGHSVAAASVTWQDRPAILLVDALESHPALPQLWPWAYLRGAKWPEGFVPQPDVHAVELYARGLDSYVWVEGYVVRGPSAGTLVSAGVPYLPDRTRPRLAKVFDPDLPAEAGPGKG